MGFFSSAMFYYIAVLLLVIDSIIFMNRYYYTINLRDNMSWSRRHFTYENTTPAPATAHLGLFDISGVDIAGLCTSVGYKISHL